MESGKKDTKTRLLIAAVGIPVLILVLSVLPLIALPLALALINVCCAIEFIRAVKTVDKNRIFIMPVLSAAVIPFGVYFGHGTGIFMICLYLTSASMFFELMRSRKHVSGFGVAGALAGVFCGAVTPMFMSYLVDLRGFPYGRYLVLLPFVVSMFGDTGGYFLGRKFGKHHPFPDISPKKSTEGCLGSLAFSIVFTVLFGAVVSLLSDAEPCYGNLALLGLAVNPAAQFGDLVFSAVKRETGIKDFSRILGDHGGMQDRFDSTVFAVPVVWAFVNLLPVFR